MIEVPADEHERRRVFASPPLLRLPRERCKHNRVWLVQSVKHCSRIGATTGSLGGEPSSATLPKMSFLRLEQVPVNTSSLKTLKNMDTRRLPSVVVGKMIKAC